MTQFAIMIPFGEAVLCVSCKVVSNASGQTCPACGGGPLMNIARVLDRELDNKEAAL